MHKIEIIKPTLFIDIDGTIVDSNENPVPFAISKINECYDNGYTIIITTMRGDKFFDQKSRFCKQKTVMLLNSIELKYHSILWDVPSPRVIINDEGAIAINHKKDSSWENYNFEIKE